MAQAVGHGVIFPVISRTKYSPGFLASIFLHTPIGLAYLTALKTRGQITRGDWIRSIAYVVVFAFFGVASPNLFFKDKDSPHAFTEDQMGPFAVPAAITAD
jgi:hypothetical protein